MCVVKLRKLFPSFAGVFSICSTLSSLGHRKIHTKHVKTAGLDIIHLNTVQVLIVYQYFVLVTDWCFINVNQRTKRRENHSQLLI